jgi:hypothetical protein
MLELTAQARGRLDEYLRAAELHLRDAGVEDAQEVPRDLREHIEHELQEMAQPISLQDLEAVLQRVGDPAHLAPEGEGSWRRPTAPASQGGPRDWWLAWLALALLVVGGAFAGPIGPILGFLVARAALAIAAGGQGLGPRRWLLYPPLIAVYVPLAGVLFWWPLILLVASHGLSAKLIHCLTLLVWWLILYGLARLYPSFLPSLFAPFVRPGRRWVAAVALCGLLVCGLPALLVHTTGVTRVDVVKVVPQNPGATP